MTLIYRLHLAWHRFQEWRFIRHAERVTGLKLGVLDPPDQVGESE